MGRTFISSSYFFQLFSKYIPPNQSKKGVFNCIRVDISTYFVEKVEIATIFLHNFIIGGYLHQIDRYFHLMSIDFIRVERTT